MQNKITSILTKPTIQIKPMNKNHDSISAKPMRVKLLEEAPKASQLLIVSATPADPFVGFHTVHVQNQTSLCGWTPLRPKCCRWIVCIDSHVFLLYHQNSQCSLMITAHSDRPYRKVAQEACTQKNNKRGADQSRRRGLESPKEKGGGAEPSDPSGVSPLEATDP